MPVNETTRELDYLALVIANADRELAGLPQYAELPDNAHGSNSRFKAVRIANAIDRTQSPIAALTGDVYGLIEAARSVDDHRALIILRYIHEKLCEARYTICGRPFDRPLPVRPTFVPWRIP